MYCNFRFPFSYCVPHPFGFPLVKYSGCSKCRVFHWSLLHGHAGQYHHQRSLHAGHTTIWWFFGYKYTTMAHMDEVYVYGAFCISEYADRWVWRRTAYQVSFWMDVGLCIYVIETNFGYLLKIITTITKPFISDKLLHKMTIILN